MMRCASVSVSDSIVFGMCSGDGVRACHGGAQFALRRSCCCPCCCATLAAPSDPNLIPSPPRPATATNPKLNPTFPANVRSVSLTPHDAHGRHSQALWRVHALSRPRFRPGYHLQRRLLRHPRAGRSPQNTRRHPVRVSLRLRPAAVLNSPATAVTTAFRARSTSRATPRSPSSCTTTNTAR